MANKKKTNVSVEQTETTVKVRKTKIDYIPEDMVEEFNALQERLASRKGGQGRAYSNLTPEQIQAKAEKARKRLAALEAALGR